MCKFKQKKDLVLCNYILQNLATYIFNPTFSTLYFWKKKSGCAVIVDCLTQIFLLLFFVCVFSFSHTQILHEKPFSTEYFFLLQTQITEAATERCYLKIFLNNSARTWEGEWYLMFYHWSNHCYFALLHISSLVCHLKHWKLTKALYKMKPTLINTAMCLCIVCVCELSLGIQWFMLI